MSRRHQASRRRTYGRRQHELHERPELSRIADREEVDRALDRRPISAGFGRFELGLAPGLVFLGVD